MVIFSKVWFYYIRKFELCHLRMKHNFIQMTATAGLTVPHSINPIFQYIFDCLGFNPMNGNSNFVFQGLNCLWMVSVTLILNGSPQQIVQRGQITALRRPIDIGNSADYLIFENGASDGYQASVLGLFKLCRPSYRGFYAKFSSEKCEECSVPEDDDELMLMDVQTHYGQQQQYFRLSALDENVNELFCPITTQFYELASQIDPLFTYSISLIYVCVESHHQPL